MEKGLYKKISDTEISYAANSVNYPSTSRDGAGYIISGVVLIVADYEGHQGEIYDGWFWFNSRDEAKAALGVTDPVIPEILTQTI